MVDTEDGFVVLVHIPMGRPMAPYRDVYLVGSSTSDEAEARIKDLYPSEPNLMIYASPLQISAAKNLRLARNEVRSWLGSLGPSPTEQ
jgi:hypothetical protein